MPRWVRGERQLATQDYGEEWVTPVLFSRAPDGYLFDILDVLPRPPCPYPGMVPFSEKEKDYFHGRENEVEQAVQQLRLYPFLSIIGPSGSGKSSLVFAGILPKLQAAPRLGQAQLAIQVIRPGATPLATLAQALGLAAVPGEEEAASWAQAVASQAPLVLVVDQFEELFAPDQQVRQERAPFQQVLLHLVEAQRLRCCLLSAPTSTAT